MHTTMVELAQHAAAYAVIAADPVPGEGGAAAAQAASQTPTLFSYMLKGGVISIVLILLSVAAVAMVVWNLLELRLVRLMPPHVMDGLAKLLAARNVDGAIQFCRQTGNESFISRVMANGLTRTLKSPFGMLEVRNKLEDAAARELEVLDRPTNIIGMLAAVGPMLGLLGTVIGLIGAFQTLSSLEGAARSNELSRFMAYALVATAEGLVLAIPCTFLYAVFKRRTTRLVGMVGQEAETLVAALQGPPGASAQTAAPRPAAAPAQQAVRPAAAPVAGGAVPVAKPV